MSKSCWDAYLARSRPALLTVRSRWHRTQETRRQDIVAHFQRIQHFNLEISPFDTEVLDAALPETAPNLRNLAVECDDNGDYRNDNEGDEWGPSLDDFLYNHAPALQTLYLGLIQFPWGVQPANLRSLRLSTFVFNRDLTDEEMASHGFEYVLDTLRAAPSLEIVKLHGDIIFKPPLQIPTPTISSSLRELSLIGTVSRMSPLLAAYKANPGLYVELRSEEHYDELEGEAEAETTDDWTTDSAVASKVLHNHLISRGSGGPAEFTAFHLVFNRFSIALRLGFQVAPLSLDFETSTEQRDCHPSINIILSPQKLHCNPTSIHAKTLKLARGVPVAQLGYIRYLTLTGLGWPKDDIVSFFRYTDLVESLTIRSVLNRFTGDDLFAHNTASLLAHVLCSTTPPSDETTSGSNKVLLLPALKNLYIIGVSFNYTVQCDGHDMMLDTALTSALTTRQQSVCGLGTLHLEDCRYVKESVLELWTGLVPRVTRTSGMK